MSKVVKAIILTGGRGTRLGKLTNITQKTMLDINGRPFLEYITNQLKKYNIYQIIFCTGYRAEQIKRHFKDGSDFGLKIEYSHEEKPLGTGGAIKNCTHLINETFIVMNGDTFIDVDYGCLLEFHKLKKSLCTIVLTGVKNPQRYGSVTIWPDGRIKSFMEKAIFQQAGTKMNQNSFISAGVYVFEPEILNNLPKWISSLERDIFPSIKSGIYGFVHNGKFIDIGIPEDLRIAREKIKYGNNKK